MTTEVQTQSQETEASAVPPSLQLSDLRSMMTVIEVISQRGGFKADELIVVGTLYNRISAFVAAATPAEQVEEADAAQDQADATVAEAEVAEAEVAETSE
jgi:translation initiation factor IF-2